MSTKPGASTSPPRSTSSAPLPPGTSPTATIRPPSTPTSAERRSAPVPSMPVPFRRISSVGPTRALASRGRGLGEATAEQALEHLVGGVVGAHVELERRLVAQADRGPVHERALALDHGVHVAT